jgi:dephospho-CoA kinase
MRGGIDQEEIYRRIASAQRERELAKTFCDHVLDTNNILLKNIKNINQLVKNILDE